jgi:hypothetical protein
LPNGRNFNSDALAAIPGLNKSVRNTPHSEFAICPELRLLVWKLPDGAAMGIAPDDL